MATCGISAWSADVSYFYGSNLSLFSNGSSALSSYSSTAPAVSLGAYGVSAPSNSLSAYVAVNNFAGTTYGSSFGSAYGTTNTASTYQPVMYNIGSSGSGLGAYTSSYSGYSSGGSSFSGYSGSSSLIGYGSSLFGSTNPAPLQIDVVNLSIGPVVTPMTTPAPVSSPGVQFVQAPNNNVVGIDAVPEPASLLLVAGGLGLAAVLRKRFVVR